MSEFTIRHIGNTPLVPMSDIFFKYNLKANLHAKVEGMNPFGSVKDRVALEMLLELESPEWYYKNIKTIIEATSGNTGIGLAAVGVPMGYRVIIVMPDTMSKERIDLIKAYGAEVVLTDGKSGMSGAIAEAERLHKEIENSYIPDQFNNPANVNAHYKTTGVEIRYGMIELYEDNEDYGLEKNDGKVDILVAGVGTGGTITGTGKYLKEIYPDMQIVAVEPKSWPVLSGGKANPHGLQGIGANFVPKLLDMSLIDEIIGVAEEDAYEACRMLYKTEGIFAGISSGAALFAAIEVAKREENVNKNIVVILPDSGTRYISTGLFK